MQPDPAIIGPEAPDDAAAIEALLRLCFDGPAEARLVERLRRDGDVVAGLVARSGAAVVGHVLLSALSVKPATGAAQAAAALAPLAVHPAVRRRGIGAELVRSGLGLCGDRGIAAVFVLGDPAYYRRFGFSADLAHGFDTHWPGESFQCLELEAGALRGRSGRVVYAKAFEAL